MMPHQNTRRHRAVAAVASIAMIVSALTPAATMAQDASGTSDEELGLLAYLGLEAAEGKAEIKDEAGNLEAAILMAPTLHHAAKALFQHNAFYGSFPIIPLVGGATLDMRALAVTKMRLAVIKRINTSVAGNCPKFEPKPVSGTAVGKPKAIEGESGGGDDNDDGGIKLDDSTQGLLSNALALLKTDTTYSGIKLTANNEMLLSALADAAGDRIFIPGERIFLTDNPFDTELVQLVAAIEPKLQSCTKYKEAAEKAKDEEAVNTVKAIVEQLQLAKSLAATLTALGEKNAPSLIEQAGVLHHAQTENPMVLRVDIAAIGGTMVQRKSVWTTLGIDGGISIRGGVALGWRLLDPTSGKAVSAGTVYCASPTSAFHNVYDRAKEVAEANCRHVSRNGPIGTGTGVVKIGGGLTSTQ
jgi:hypothetical protein